MKKILVSILVVMISLAAWGCSLSAEKESENLNTYTAILNYNESAHTLSGQMKVDYINKSSTTLKNIKFNLWASAFRENSSQPVISLAKSEECYYNGPSFGGIEILSVKNFEHELCGQDENILKVKLDSSLAPSQTTSIEMEFLISLPNISHRFGYGENTINFGNFLPTLCVLENGEWVEIEYHSNGDPFYSECANYNVTVTFPDKFVLASTGACSQTETAGGQTTKTISAPSVRDFAMVLSEKLKVESASTDGIKVNYYYHSDTTPLDSLKVAVKSVETFNNLFGKYPYKELDVVQANFCIGGMEFPNMVLIGDTITDKTSYEMVIVHEIAHQWWYGVVGNNQTSHAWLDEGLAEFSTALFYEKNEGYPLTYENIIATAKTRIEVFQEVQSAVVGNVDLSMNKNLADFENENHYIATTYVQGLLLFDALKDLLGEKMVLKCLKNYFTTFAFKISTPELLISSFEKTTSLNLEPFFDSWVQGKVVFGG